MSTFSWSLAQSHDADLRPGDLFEIRDTETGQVVYRRLIDDSDVERGQFNVPAGVLEDGVMYGHRVKRQSDGGEWSASSVFSLARPPEKGATPATPATLTDFLLARIAEDEAVARAAAAAGRPRGGWGSEDGVAGEQWVRRRSESGMVYTPAVENRADAALWDDEGGCDYMAPAPEVGAHIARHDPARVLAECEAKRRIVELMSENGGADSDFDSGWDAALVYALEYLAVAYADHADYDEEWRP